MKRLLIALTASASLILVGCNSDKDNNEEAPEINTSNIDEARASFEQFEDEVASKNEEEKIKEREKKENKDVRKSDALSENSALNPPKLTDKEKKKGEEYDLPDEYKEFKKDTEENVLQNFGYLGYDEDNYLSVGDKIYHRYVTGKKDEDKVSKDESENAKSFFLDGVRELGKLPGLDNTRPRVGEDYEALKKIADSKFNKEEDFLEDVAKAQKNYGDPKIIDVTRDYNDKGLYQVQFEYQDDNGRAMLNGVTYYFVDVLDKEQLQIQRAETTIFGAKAISDWVDGEMGSTN